MPTPRRGAQHTDTARSTSTDGFIPETVPHPAAGRHGEAEAELRLAVDACAESFGPEADNQLTRQAALNLGGLLNAQGNYPEAEAMLAKVLRMAEARMGLSNAETAAVAQSMVAVLSAQGKATQAAAISRKYLRSAPPPRRRPPPRVPGGLPPPQ